MIPDYQEGKGVVVMKVHHTFSDGLGITHLLLGLSGASDPKCIPGMKSIPFFQKLAIYLILPFLVLKETVQVLLTKSDVNSINNWHPLTGTKKAAHLSLDVQALKKVSQANKCKVNDILMTITCLSLRDHLDQASSDPAFKEFEVPKEIQILAPISFREPVAKFDDVVMTNSLSIIKTKLPLLDSFKS